MRDSNLGLVKSDTVLPTARLRRDISLKEAMLLAGLITRRWGPQTRYTLWRNTTYTVKDLILIIFSDMKRSHGEIEKQTSD